MSPILTTWIDNWWGARLDAPAKPLAAISIGPFTVWIFGAIAALVNMGVTALVARHEGAGKPAAEAYVAYQGGSISSAELTSASTRIAPAPWRFGGGPRALRAVPWRVPAAHRTEDPLDRLILMRRLAAKSLSSSLDALRSTFPAAVVGQTPSDDSIVAGGSVNACRGGS